MYTSGYGRPWYVFPSDFRSRTLLGLTRRTPPQVDTSVSRSLSPVGYHESFLPKPVNSTSIARLMHWVSVCDDARPSPYIRLERSPAPTRWMRRFSKLSMIRCQVSDGLQLQQPNALCNDPSFFSVWDNIALQSSADRPIIEKA